MRESSRSCAKGSRRDDVLSVAGIETGGGAQPSVISYLFPLLAIVFIYYFVLIRPQQKESQRHRKLLDTLKKGDEVVTDSVWWAPCRRAG